MRDAADAGKGEGGGQIPDTCLYYSVPLVRRSSYHIAVYQRKTEPTRRPVCRLLTGSCIHRRDR